MRDKPACLPYSSISTRVYALLHAYIYFLNQQSPTSAILLTMYKAVSSNLFAKLKTIYVRLYRVDREIW